MSENCVHKPDVNCGTFLRRYFQKDGILMQTLHCRLCSGDIRFVKKPVYRLLDVLIWILLLAFMLLARLYKDSATQNISLWLYIVIAVVLVSLLGLLLDMAKEWFLLKCGRFELVKPEVKEEETPEDSDPKITEE
jgi:uncharacterized protein (DUF983 family)